MPPASVKNLKNLKTMRQEVNWEVKSERLAFLRRLYPLIGSWQCRLPNLLDIFAKEEIECLLSDSMRYCNRNSSDGIGERFISFVARTGYKNEPEVDEDGKALLRRTTPLHHANYQRSVATDLFKIYDRFDVNCTDESGLSHFHVACQFGLEDVVGKFLEHGQDPNGLPVRAKVDPPLHSALSHERAVITEILLRNGADPNLPDKDGFTPLHIICSIYISPMTKVFFKIIDELNLTVQVNAQDKSGNTPLHLALGYDCKETPQMLLERGADINLTNDQGRSALHVVCSRYNNTDVLEMFFKITQDKLQSVQVNAQDNEGNTPLHSALKCGNNKAMELLLRNGANPNVPNAKGLTPLHIMINKERIDYDMLELFFTINGDIQQTVQINAQDNEGNTPLHLALLKMRQMTSPADTWGRPKFSGANWLLRRGADPNLANAEVTTALHIICQIKYDLYFYADPDDDVVQLLFKINDDKHQLVQVDAKDKFGRTSLQWAVANHLPDVVDALLDHGADLSSFVFPDSSYFGEKIEIEYDAHSNAQLRRASTALTVIERLEKRGYVLHRNDALTIMNNFNKHESFGFREFEEFDYYWYDEEEFASEAKKITMKPNLSLYELLQLRLEEAAKRVTCSDYYALTREYDSYFLFDVLSMFQGDKCADHLCEMMARRFYRRYALDSFLDLIRCRLPIFCCKMIIDYLYNQDLWHICLAATNKSS